LGKVAAPNTQGRSILYSLKLTAPDVEKSANLTLAPNSISTDDEYWACFSVSPTTYVLGWASGDSKDSALSAAQAECGSDDCNIDKCVEEGCIAIAFDGVSDIEIEVASGYGHDDEMTAGNLALAACQADGVTGCAVYKTFCSASTA
jgi:hypothetical protein